MNNYSSGLVSIITPLYNGKNYIVSTMESVIDQTYENWEMIIVDDGSTDGSKELVEEFLSNRKESRIKLFENPSNLGISATRNSGLEKAKGQYICFLDSDDLWDQNKIEKELSFLQEVRKKDTKAAFV
ncbi:MAG: glycosyltransferase, partial [Lachnospiraceae bacterium]|nr:glycosyltransferase [Lachnospiraceae bacterium]